MSADGKAASIAKVRQRLRDRLTPPELHVISPEGLWEAVQLLRRASHWTAAQVLLDYYGVQIGEVHD